MTDVASAPNALAHAGLEGTETLVDVLFRYIVPIVALFVGFFVIGQQLGGAAIFAKMFSMLTGTSSTGAAAGLLNASMTARLAWASAAGLWGGTGILLWHVSERVGKWGLYLLRPISLLFVGAGLYNVPGILTANTSMPLGWVDSLTVSATQEAAASGGAA